MSGNRKRVALEMNEWYLEVAVTAVMDSKILDHKSEKMGVIPVHFRYLHKMILFGEVQLLWKYNMHISFFLLFWKQSLM